MGGDRRSAPRAGGTAETARADSPSEAGAEATGRGNAGAPGRAAARPRSRAGLAGLALAALAPAVLTGGARAQGTQAGDVALFELSTPGVIDFTLRATLPVPKSTYPRPDGLSPFSIRDIDGSLVPAQVEPVTWYPDKAKHGADVLEVVARVQRPAGFTPDNQIFYPLVAAPVATQGPNLTQTVQDFLAERDSMVLETRDAFGNKYTVDLRRGKYGKDVLKSGRWSEQTRYYGVMKPLKAKTGPGGTLHHLFGVHSYVTTYTGEDIISLDLRLHNGMSGLDKQDLIDDPNWHLYFDQLNVRVPNGWTVIQSFDDPLVGAPIVKKRYTLHPIVEANSDGTLHVFPQQSQMHRRLVITPIGNEARAQSVLHEEWLGFARQDKNSETGKNLWSWWQPSTARYFPQNTVMPDLKHIGADACRSKLQGDLTLFSGHMAAGTQMNAYPLHSVRLGWAHPWGVKYGGMTSGAEIFLYDGMSTAWGASNAGYRMHQLRHRMYADRHPTMLVNKDGSPTQVHQWLLGPPNNKHVDMNFYMRLLPNGNDPFGLTQAPKWQANYVASAGLKPWYEADLLAHDNIDMQHLIRYTHSPKVLMWLGNDSLAKDDLRHQAEIVRLSYHPYYTSPNQGVIVSGMLDDIQFVEQHPDLGFSFGRGEAWAVDTMLAAYAMGDDAWRAQALPWFDDVTDMVWDGQGTCNGFILAKVSSKTLNGQHRARQSIEQAMVENALWGTMETVYRGVDAGNVARLDSIIRRSVYSMIGNLAWDPVQRGPHSQLAVGPLNLTLPLYCTQASFPNSGGTAGGIDKWQTWSSFAYGYLLTSDDQFLEKALDMTWSTKSLNGALESIAFSNLENKFALIALSQRVDYP